MAKILIPLPISRTTINKLNDVDWVSVFLDIILTIFILVTCTIVASIIGTYISDVMGVPHLPIGTADSRLNFEFLMQPYVLGSIIVVDCIGLFCILWLKGVIGFRYYEDGIKPFQ